MVPGDTRSTISFSDMMTLVRASDVTVHVVGFLDHQSSSGRAEQRARLVQIANATGGQAFFPATMKDVETAYDKVVAQIRAQYSIGAAVSMAVATAVAAAAAVYFFDPESGRRRRALLRDQTARTYQRGSELANKVGRGAQQGAIAIFRRSKRWRGASGGLTAEMRRYAEMRR